MYKILFVVFAGLFGAAFGSFACCQAWRIRLKEEKKKDLGKRSVCLHCGKKLSWYENIPILSWLIQGGKCRKCGKKIGVAEIMSEVFGMMSFALIAWKFVSGIPAELDLVEFVGSLDLASLAAVLASMVGMLILAVYDGKWGELPIGILLYSIIMGLVYAVLGLINGQIEILSLLGGVALLAGTYYLLYFFSKEKLVGGGDWMLCLAIGLLLGDWRLALFELFLANFLGAIVMLPLKKKRMAFGPFLILGFVIIFTAQNYLVDLIGFSF